MSKTEFRHIGKRLDIMQFVGEGVDLGSEFSVELYMGNTKSSQIGRASSRERV